MEKLWDDFSFGLFFWQALLFFILLFLLRKFAWKPILSAVDEREKSISKSLDEAKAAREEMANLKAENELILKEAKQERDNILKEAREIKAKIINEAKEEAKIEADKLIVLAKESIQNEKMSAKTELKNQVAHLALDMAEKVLGTELSEKGKQDDLMNDLIKNIDLN